MCGRFTITNPDPALLASTFDLTASVDAPLSGLSPHYNVAPTQTVLAVVRDLQGINRLARFMWGLVPSWSKDSTGASKMINARGETVADKPSFRSALSKRRCLVIADGFYEWQSQADGPKTPMYITVGDHKPFGMAGLWELWTDRASGETLSTCTVITTSPNALMVPIHNRMPVIIPRESYREWLDPTQTDGHQAAGLLLPFPAEQMTVYPVSRRVNNVRSDDPGLIEKVAS